MSTHKMPEFFKCSIESQADAEAIIRETGYGWYGVAILCLLFGAIVYLTQGSWQTLAEAPYFILFGYFFPLTRSRVLGTVLLGGSVLMLCTTLAAVFGIIQGGTNLIVACIVVWMAYRGLRATVVYHRLIGSQIAWRNVLKVGAIAGGILIVTSLVLLIVFEFGQDGHSGLSMEVINHLFVLGLVCALTLSLFMLRRSLPVLLTSASLPAVCGQSASTEMATDKPGPDSETDTNGKKTLAIMLLLIIAPSFLVSVSIIVIFIGVAVVHQVNPFQVLLMPDSSVKLFHLRFAPDTSQYKYTIMGSFALGAIVGGPWAFWLWGKFVVNLRLVSAEFTRRIYEGDYGVHGLL